MPPTPGQPQPEGSTALSETAGQAATSSSRWYESVSSAQWWVLAIASAGWIFDSYAAQIYNITRSSMLSELLRLRPEDPGIRFWGEIILAINLVGGMIGGVYFGALADRIGRRRALMVTIAIYTLFGGATCLARTAWQVAVLRSFGAMGAAGAWVVGASVVAEVFPPRARAQAGAVFHSTSTIGVGLAALVGMAAGANWRLAYLVGVLPIFLVFAVRSGVPETSDGMRQPSTSESRREGSLRELLFTQPWGHRAILGMLLAAVGVGTYWSISVGGQDLVQDFLIRKGVGTAAAMERSQFAYGFLINGGGFLGALGFGPLAQWLGRRRAFGCAMVGAMLVVPATWYLPQTYGALLAMLPLYGALTFGFHAGFAFYFPELFPSHLRGVGAGFCFNCGRPLAAGILAFSGWLKSRPWIDLREAVCLLALLYLLGLLCLRFLPETKDRRLDNGSQP